VVGIGKERRRECGGELKAKLVYKIPSKHISYLYSSPGASVEIRETSRADGKSRPKPGRSWGFQAKPEPLRTRWVV